MPLSYLSLPNPGVLYVVAVAVATLAISQDMLCNKLQEKKTSINKFLFSSAETDAASFAAALCNKETSVVCVCACVGSCVHIMRMVFS